MSFLAVTCGLGLARQSYALILPSMRDGLGLSYTQAGLLQTANLIGYMLASFGSGALAARYSSRLIMASGVILSGLSLAGTALVPNFELAVLARLFTGVGTATMVVGYVPLIAGWFPPARRGRVLGATNGGSGAGVALSGVLVPVLLAVGVVGPATAGPGDNWRAAWLGLGALTTLVGVVILLVVRDATIDPTAAGRHRGGGMWGWLLPIAAVYTLFGLANGVYITFFAAMLLNRLGPGADPGRLWTIVGVLAIASPFVWGWVSDRIGSRAGLLIVLAVLALACTLIPATGGVPGALASVAFFGITYGGVPSLVSVLVARLATSEQVGAAVGRVSIGYSLGQGVGPAIAGALVTASGFSAAYVLAAVLAALAFVLILALRVGATGMVAART